MAHASPDDNFLDDGGSSEGYDEVADMLEEFLIEHGAATVDELSELLLVMAPALVSELAAEDSDDPVPTLEDAAYLVRSVTNAYDEFWPLPDGRVGALLLASRPARFSHRISADELERGALDSFPDLTGLHGDFTFALRDGGTCIDEQAPFPGAAPMGSLIGPTGWLDEFAPEDLVVIDWDGSTITPEAVAPSIIDPADDQRVIDALRTTLTARRSDRAPEPFELLISVRLQEPALFARTVSPLGELLTRAGIEVREGWLGWADQPWVTPREQAQQKRYESTMQSPDLERCCRDELRFVYDAWRSWDDGSLSPSAADRIAKALDHGPVPDHLWDIMSLWAKSDLGPWADAVAASAADTSAGLRYLSALVADGRCEPREAIEHLEHAYSLEPSQPAVVLMLAGFRADQGDGQGAASLLGRLGVSRDDQLFKDLAPHAVALAGIGRNERCPCGSGRKFKTCCARTPQLASLTTRLRWLLPRASRFAGQRDGEALFSFAERLESAYRAQGDPVSVVVTALELVLFDLGHLAEYLRARGELLAEDEREAAWTWVDEKPRLLEVVSTIPGESFDALDLRSGDRLVVGDAAASRSLAVGQSVVLRALPAGPEWLVAGGVLVVPMQARSWVLEKLDGPFYVSTYFEIIAGLTADRVLRNREGDDLVLLRANYAVDDAAAVRAALVDLDDIVTLDDPDDELGGLALEFRLNEDETILRGRFEFSEGVVVIDTNSAERLELMGDLLVTVASDAELIDVEETGPDDLFRGVRERRDQRDDLEADDFVEAPMTPEMAAMVEEHMRTLERRWVDEQIPALGGLTPKQAMLDPTRRGDLEHLLDGMSGLADGKGFNAERIRDLLGM